MLEGRVSVAVGKNFDGAITCNVEWEPALGTSIIAELVEGDLSAGTIARALAAELTPHVAAQLEKLLIEIAEGFIRSPQYEQSLREREGDTP